MNKTILIIIGIVGAMIIAAFSVFYMTNNPKTIHEYIMEAHNLRDKGKYKESFELLDKAILYYPRGWGWVLWAEKGDLWAGLQKDDEAIKAYDKSFELDPTNIVTLDSKGHIAMRSGKYDEAINAYTKIIEIKPEEFYAWYFRSFVYSIRRDKQKTLSDLAKAISLFNDYKENAKKNTAFKWLWEDEEFKNLTQ